MSQQDTRIFHNTMHNTGMPSGPSIHPSRDRAAVKWKIEGAGGRMCIYSLLWPGILLVVKLKALPLTPHNHIHL